MSIDLCGCGWPLLPFPLPLERSSIADDFTLNGCPNPDCGAVFVGRHRGVFTFRPSSTKKLLLVGVTYSELLIVYQAVDPNFRIQLPESTEDVIKSVGAFLKFDASKVRLPEKVIEALSEARKLF